MDIPNAFAATRQFPSSVLANASVCSCDRPGKRSAADWHRPFQKGCTPGRAKNWDLSMRWLQAMVIRERNVVHSVSISDPFHASTTSSQNMIGIDMHRNGKNVHSTINGRYRYPPRTFESISARLVDF